jgi:uncharacterized protein YcfJ
MKKSIPLRPAKNVLALTARTLLAALALVSVSAVQAQVLFYEHQDFQGRSVTTDKALDNFVRSGFNDRASSIIVLNNRWEVCDDSYFGGRCVVLRQGRYPSLAAMGMNDRISSVREVHPEARFDDSRYAPMAPQPVYDSRRRRNEKLFEAQVVDVRAVLGAPQQRCWMEREQYQSNDNQVPGALAGALIGGILGHQIGNGDGRNVATAGGAIVGAAVGANVARNNAETSTRDVQRCTTTPSQAKPEFWDVTYKFRGQEHHVQMTTQPRKTITVNAQGEPRA